MLLECKFDVNTTFAETSDYGTCMGIRRAVIEHKQAQVTWGIISGIPESSLQNSMVYWILLIVGGVVGFLVLFIGCLYCLHRRNVHQMSRRVKINNQNVKTIKAQQMDPVEPSEEPVSGSPQKLLIKRSDV